MNEAANNVGAGKGKKSKPELLLLFEESVNEQEKKNCTKKHGPILSDVQKTTTTTTHAQNYT